MNRQWCCIGVVVLVVLAGNAMAAASDEQGGAAGRPSMGGQPTAIALDKLKRASLKKSGRNLFATKSWGGISTPSKVKSVPASDAAPVPAPAAAVVPSLPFSYMGKMLDEQSGKLVIYLARGDVSYAISQGDVIDENYRVEAITDTELTLIYIPLRTKQTLNIGGKDS